MDQTEISLGHSLCMEFDIRRYSRFYTEIAGILSKLFTLEQYSLSF